MSGIGGFLHSAAKSVGYDSGPRADGTRSNAAKRIQSAVRGNVGRKKGAEAKRQNTEAKNEAFATRKVDMVKVRAESGANVKNPNENNRAEFLSALSKGPGAMHKESQEKLETRQSNAVIKAGKMLDDEEGVRSGSYSHYIGSSYSSAKKSIGDAFQGAASSFLSATFGRPAKDIKIGAFGYNATLISSQDSMDQASNEDQVSTAQAKRIAPALSDFRKDNAEAIATEQRVSTMQTAASVSEGVAIGAGIAGVVTGGSTAAISISAAGVAGMAHGAAAGFANQAGSQYAANIDNSSDGPQMWKSQGASARKEYMRGEGIDELQKAGKSFVGAGISGGLEAAGTATDTIGKLGGFNVTNSTVKSAALESAGPLSGLLRGALAPTDARAKGGWLEKRDTSTMGIGSASSIKRTANHDLATTLEMQTRNTDKNEGFGSRKFAAVDMGKVRTDSGAAVSGVKENNRSNLLSAQSKGPGPTHHNKTLSARPVVKAPEPGSSSKS